MAFTKIVGPGIHTLANITSHNVHSSGIITATKFDGPFDNINVSGAATFTGNVTIGGTLTYEDVTNIDSVGIVTAREGVFIPDIKQLKLGNTDADPDLQIHHTSGSHSIVHTETGNLSLSTNSGKVQLSRATGDGTSSYVKMVEANYGNSVDLYYNGQKKFETSNTGATVTGTVKASTGILFGSDTADDNKLDDYEEGTWTPTVVSSGNIGTPQTTCTYTKIGRLVTINADIHQLSDTTSSTFIKIGGLPFVPSGTVSNEHSAVCHGERYKGGSSSIIVAYILYNSGSYGISFRFGVAGNHYSGVRHSDISDDGSDNNLRFTLTYEIT